MQLCDTELYTTFPPFHLLYNGHSHISLDRSNPVFKQPIVSNL